MLRIGANLPTGTLRLRKMRWVALVAANEAQAWPSECAG